MKELPICDTSVCQRGRKKAIGQLRKQLVGGEDRKKWKVSNGKEGAAMRLKEKSRLSNLRRLVSVMDSG